MMNSLLILCFLAADTTADTSRVWSSAEIKSLEQKMAARKEKVGTESLAVLSNYQMSVAYRS
jgi:hypothetical protein